MILIIAALIVSLAIGFALSKLISTLRERAILSGAQSEAERILSEAKDRAQEVMDESKEKSQDVEEQIRNQNQRELERLEKLVDDLEMQYRAKRSESDRLFNQDQKELQKQMSLISDRAKVVSTRQQNYDRKKEQIAKIKSELIVALTNSSGQDIEVVKRQILDDLENQIQIDAKKKANQIEEDTKLHSESIAKEILANALARFPREACAERGIGMLEIVDQKMSERIFGKDRVNIKKLEELCGVDIELNDNNYLQASGFDPVRRELSARCLEKMVDERNLNPQIIERIYEFCKKDLFKKIELDGKKATTEMNQQDLHPEIKNMIGCLRYRYSFAQNQFFHVGEVGWLCGLLASELGGVKIADAKRSGLLHDIGKAMDHSIDGGHAVIGADFIKRLGEKEHIVHAVRAHHYEEQPSTDLAFLVIAADAISGARPGARRSTVNNYNQKIEVLSTIADDFKGVLRTLVFNAGREVRVIVDSQKMTDVQTLSLCKDIAKKIENECSYPGQIKVVVVRETHAEAVAK